MKMSALVQWSVSAVLLVLAATVCDAELSLDRREPVETGPAVAPAASVDRPPRSIAPEPVLHLVVEFVDGSRVVGIPDIELVPLRTTFAEMDIPLERIAGVTFNDDKETASVKLRNGDSLTGVMDLKAMELKTAFGRISAAPDQLRRLSVCPAGMPPGLLLWDRLDGTPTLVGPAVDFLGNESFVQGKVGRALELSGNHEWGVQVALGKLKNTSRGTIEFWMKVIKKPSTVSHGSGPTYDVMSGGLYAQYNANNGHSHGKYSIGNGRYFVYSERYSSSKSTDLLGQTGVWNHYAIEWDAEGIEGRNGQKLIFLINGKPHGKYQPGTGDASRFAGPLHEDTKAEYLTLHRNRNGFAGTMVYDELKIWDHPIADFKRIPTLLVPDDDAEGERKPGAFLVTFTDGSHVMGRAGLKDLIFTTESIGRVSVPTRRIAKLEFDDKHETWQAVLNSGDTLVGVLGHKDLPFSTIFGPISAKPEHIVSVRAQD